MLKSLWKLSAGHRLMPWRSPYLRWRIETYWGIEADHISTGEFLQFCWAHRGELIRFLEWAHRMEHRPKPPRVMPGRVMDFLPDQWA